jgi:NAD(P)-dependent dehydrogenase (short-subunit alcohol dehydrogenase family)
MSRGVLVVGSSSPIGRATGRAFAAGGETVVGLEDVADAVLFLAGAGFITGVVLPVDGGLSISSPAAFLRPDLRARWLQ